MKVQHTWKYLSLLVVLGFWGCSSSKQLAGESDDLYGSSADAPVYASKESRPVERNRTASQRYEDSRMNANPDFNDQTSGLADDEYYSEVTARKVTRGISPDPGWSSDNSYTNGFSNGYNTAMLNSTWNRWGWNSPFYGGLRLGIGLGMSPWMGGFNSWRYGGFYDPFWGGSYAYSPFYGGGFGGGFYDPFYAYSPFGYGYGFNSFYNPYMYGGGLGRTVIVNNYDRIGANRNATYGARGGVSRNRYNSDFVNTPRSYNNNNGGRRSGTLNSSNNTANNNTYYSRPNNSGSTNSYGAGRANSRGADYYYGGSGSGGRANANTSSSRPSYSAPSNSDYYAAPRQNSRGSYTPPSYNSGSRVSSPQQTYQAPSRTFEAPQRTYSPPSQPSYSAPSYGGSRGGGSSSGGGGYSGGGGGGSRGPR
ncbi:hypothetical protein LX87_04960 [Larkinella arboricola]|uniref:Prolyl-tRNA synthetase n=1 Tax=Larkinella arboricola TaxID=643671 RepID=A0A327WMV8_LARAB|nr:hypothetical protein [Larkinella arboricola]RAJ92630.1 hypothetical protein LX87_04960 [Larkinella arboricola]